QAAGGDNLKATGHVRRHALAFPHRRHAEVEKDHVHSRAVGRCAKPSRHATHQDHFSCKAWRTRSSIFLSSNSLRSPATCVHWPARLKTNAQGAAAKCSRFCWTSTGSSRMRAPNGALNFCRNLRTSPVTLGGGLSSSMASIDTDTTTRPSFAYL